MTTFNPQEFVDLEITESLERRPPLPVGDYTAMIGDVTCVPWQSSKDSAKSGLRYAVPLKVQVSPALQDTLHLPFDTITLTDSIMLDITEGGLLDTSPGRNGKLRSYREALGMNKKGEGFSARKMTGQLLTVRLTHEIYNEEIQERIAGVAKIA